jgi:uncharacterized membrane-anchored protein YhcB (DUF1043 family)
MTLWIINAFLLGLLIGMLIGLACMRVLRKRAEERIEQITELWSGLADLQQEVIKSYAKTSQDALRRGKELSAALATAQDERDAA